MVAKFGALVASQPRYHLEVNESSGGDPSLEVRLEPLWRRSTLVDLAKVAWQHKPLLLFVSADPIP